MSHATEPLSVGMTGLNPDDVRYPRAVTPCSWRQLPTVCVCVVVVVVV